MPPRLAGDERGPLRECLRRILGWHSEIGCALNQAEVELPNADVCMITWVVVSDILNLHLGRVTPTKLPTSHDQSRRVSRLFCVGDQISRRQFHWSSAAAVAKGSCA